MIVEPGFFDHWKTKLLIRKLGSEAAPIAVLRLWEHCQMRKRYKFEKLSPEKLAAICAWGGNPSDFWAAMVGSWIDVEADGTFVVHDWEESNRSLISAWENGRKGGRPGRDKQPKHTEPPPAPPSPDETQDDPPGIPKPERLDLPVEFPPGFPKTEAEAIASAAFVGCTEQFASTTWNTAASRNGKDSRGNAITRWANYLKASWDYSVNRKSEQFHKAGGSTHSRQTTTHPNAEF